MSAIRISRSRRNGIKPLLDGLEDRLVLATAPTNVLAIPAQVTQLNNQVVAISNDVISVVPYTLAHGGHLDAQSTQNVIRTRNTAQADFDQLVADRDAVQQAANDQISTLREGKFLLDSQIAQNYNTQVTYIANYYNSLTPDQQTAQLSAIMANLAKVNQATQSAYQTSNTYYANKANSSLALYNQTANQINTALANAATAVKLSGNLYNYVVLGSTNQALTPLYTPLPLINPSQLGQLVQLGHLGQQGQQPA